MTHTELLAKTDGALLEIVKLHTPEGNITPQQCRHDKKFYPCPTIQIIEKELQ